MEALNIGGQLIGPGQPPYYIAEIGSNHNGDMQLCKKIIDSAKACGADAVKFQSWSKASLICRAEYARNTDYTDKHKHFGSLEDMVEKYQFTPAQHHEISEYCRKIGINFTSTPFSTAEVDLLCSLSVPFLKVASMDINHLQLLKHVGSQHKPVVLSTGMATLAEIETALQVLRENGSGPVALLHCISIYPPRFEDVHLRNISTLHTAFDVPVGFSDHSQGEALSLGAIALGACIIEKHFTIDKHMPGWDHAISADPPELESMIRAGRNLYAALGDSVRKVSADEEKKRLAFRRRIVLARKVRKGQTLEYEDLNFKRPGNGIDPHEFDYVVGRAVKRDLEYDDELSWEDLT